MWVQFVTVLNAVHLPTWLLAFVGFTVGYFTITINANGNPVDFNTTQGRMEIAVGFFMALVTFLQKVTPATPTK